MEIDLNRVGELVSKAENVPDEIVARIKRGEIQPDRITVSPLGFGTSAGVNEGEVVRHSRAKSKSVQIRIRTPEGRSHEFEASPDLGHDIHEALGRPSLR